MLYDFVRKAICAALTGMLYFGFTPHAQAVDVKVMGFTDVTLQWADIGFDKNATKDRFQGTQRTRMWTLFNVSENLRSVLMLELDNIWGANLPGMDGGALGTDGLNIGVKEAYINWSIPDTSIRVRMGLQPFVLPGIGAIHPLTRQVDSVVSMWARAAGVIVSGQIAESVGLTAFWMRPSNDNAPGSATEHLRDSADLVGLILPIVGDGYAVHPWIMYSRSGKDDPLFTYRPTLTPVYPQFSPTTVKDSNNYATGWWGGISANVTAFNPWRLGVEVNYARIDGVAREMDRGGWYALSLAEYSATNMVPGVMAWYASGDNGDPMDGSERMPTILANWFGTNMGTASRFDSLGYQSNLLGSEPIGTWGISAYLRDITFVSNIRHMVSLAYYQGTNSNSMASYVKNGFTSVRQVPLWLYLTRDDRAVEVNIGNYWDIYKNLTWAVEAGWVNLHRGDSWDIPHRKSSAIRVASTWRYTF